ncbi:MAG: SDR family oxidoreductase [Acidimicrobiales bacterium]
MKIRNKIVVVTGASSGIGRVTALALAKRGAKVWAVARDMQRLEALAAEHDGITPMRCDVSSNDDRAALIAAAGPVDILVNNAGLGYSGLVEIMPAFEVRRLFEINVLGLIDLTQRVLPGMLARKKGHIVNVSSVAGYVSSPPLTVYAATKFAVTGFTDGLRREMAGRGVGVALINPGPVNTEWGPRSMGYLPLEGSTPLKGTVGVPAWTVSNAIIHSIWMSGVPGWETIAVPRLAGLVRLGTIPAVTRLVDLSAFASRGVGRTTP